MDSQYLSSCFKGLPKGVPLNLEFVAHKRKQMKEAHSSPNEHENPYRPVLNEHVLVGPLLRFHVTLDKGAQKLVRLPQPGGSLSSRKLLEPF